MITKDQLKSNFPHAREDILNSIVENMSELGDKYDINTPIRLAHFLAQTAHESGGFRVIEENLNYSAEGLERIFAKYFRELDASEYAHKPEMIANVVYANRMGNGDTESGDGYRFRGRGLIQLTGRDNYSAMASDLEVQVDDIVGYLATADGALESAAWFWQKNGINQIADNDDVVSVTKKVNGGTIGLEERQKHTEDLKQILGV
jgi:putative chitinase